MLQHHAMTRDMPARVETHLAFAVGQNLHALGIKTVEACVRQHIPMRGLQILKAFELVFTGKIAGSIRKGLEAVEKIAQACFQMRLEHRPVAAQDFTLPGIETSKTQAVAKAASLRLTCLI